MRVTRSAVTIAAPRETVWTVLTDPSYVKRWQCGTDLITDWSAGGPIRLATAWDGGTVEQWGTVLEVRPPELLRHTLHSPRPDVPDRPGQHVTTTYTLVDRDGLTELTVTREDPRPLLPGTLAAACDEPDPEDDDEDPLLTALRALAESLL